MNKVFCIVACVLMAYITIRQIKLIIKAIKAIR